VGCQYPQAVKTAIQEIKASVDLPLDYHAHNDLGLATANALEAYKSGAEILSITVNGLGERAGNASLEQLALIISVLLKEETGIDLKRLPYLSRLVADYSGRPVGTQAPVVGSMVFSHDSGLHVDGCLKDPGVYDLFPPEIVGRETNLFPGVNSGANALKFFAAALQIELSDNEIVELKELLFEKWIQSPVKDAMGLFRECLATLGEHNHGT
jgi:homocitrate synthase NifV